MKSRALTKLFGTSLLLGCVCLAQTKVDYIQDRFENVDFGAGLTDGVPSGWKLGPAGTPMYTAQITATPACNGSRQCGSVRSVGTGPHNGSFLYQNVNATPYRGKRLTYRADVRAEVQGTSVARLLVRVHREDGSTSFRDDMGSRPITAGPWTTYQIDAPIAPDARDIEFGMQLVGEGSAWIDKVALVFGSPQNTSDDREVRALIRNFADLRNIHDGPGIAALYSENGEWSGWNVKRPVRGRQALAMVWGANSTVTVERMIECIDFLGGDVAMIRVTTQYGNPISRHHESFVMVKENGTWYIHAHQSVD